MKILIAGMGSIGRRHLRNLLTLGEDDVLLYRTHLSTLSDEELASFPVETDLGAALAHHPDAVIIANPTALHLAVAIPAANAGCHLLLEKPVAAELDHQVADLQTAVEGAGVETLVGFQFRFHPVLIKVKALLDSGAVGRPLSFRGHWGEYLPGWHPWEDYRQGYAARQDLGGGVVNTLCHPLDYVRWLFGEVKSLCALTGQVSDLALDVEDVAEIVLTFSNGVIGSLHLDYFQRPPAHWLEITASGGHIRWNGTSGVAEIYYVSGDRWESIEPPADFERNVLFLDEMRHFLALIDGDVPSSCSLMDGVQAMKLTQAVHDSARMGVVINM